MFGKLRQWNLHVNCLANGTTFQNGWRFQAGLSSLWVSWKHALKQIGSFIRFSKSLESEKSFRCRFSEVTLKSPISSILSYISLQKGCTLVTSEIKFLISKIVFCIYTKHSLWDQKFINLKWAIFFLLMQAQIFEQVIVFQRRIWNPSNS